VRLKVTFAVLNLCNTHNLGKLHVLTKVYLHINWKVHLACDLNFIIKGERLLKVMDSHVLWKSGNILEMVLDRDDMMLLQQALIGSDTRIQPI